MLVTHFKIKHDDHEFYLLFTEGDLNEFLPKTDKYGLKTIEANFSLSSKLSLLNVTSINSIKYVYGSRIHNNILEKNQTLLNYTAGQFMTQNDIDFLVSLKV